MADLLVAVSKLRRSVLPSMATTWPCVTSCNAVIQLNRHFSNSAGWIAPRMAVKRSCGGMRAETLFDNVTGLETSFDTMTWTGILLGMMHLVNPWRFARYDTTQRITRTATLPSLPSLH